MDRINIFKEIAETYYEIHALYYRLYFNMIDQKEKQTIYDLIDVLEKQAFELKAEVHI